MPASRLTLALVAALLASTLLLAAAVPASAQVAGGMVKPEPVIQGFYFNGKPVPAGFGDNDWTASLGKGAPVGNFADYCSYEMKVSAFNYGPGPLTGAMAENLEVQVDYQLADGSSGSTKGKLCFSGNQSYEVAAGCSGVETIVLPQGSSQMTLTLDPGNQIEETREDNNKYQLTINVPSPCLPSGEVALINPEGSKPGASPQRTNPARERLNKGLNFLRNVQPIKGRTATPAQPGSRQRPQAVTAKVIPIGSIRLPPTAPSSNEGKPIAQSLTTFPQEYKKITCPATGPDSPGGVVHSTAGPPATVWLQGLYVPDDADLHGNCEITTTRYAKVVFENGKVEPGRYLIKVSLKYFQVNTLPGNYVTLFLDDTPSDGFSNNLCVLASTDHHIGGGPLAFECEYRTTKKNPFSIGIGLSTYVPAHDRLALNAKVEVNEVIVEYLETICWDGSKVTPPKQCPPSKACSDGTTVGLRDSCPLPKVEPDKLKPKTGTEYQPHSPKLGTQVQPQAPKIGTEMPSPASSREGQQIPKGAASDR